VVVPPQAFALPFGPYGHAVADAALGGACAALPGAAAGAAVAVGVRPALVVGFALVAGAITVVGATLTRYRPFIPAGALIGALALVLASVTAPGATWADAAVAGLLAAGALLAGTRALGGMNERAALFGPAAATAGLIGALARVVAVVRPGFGMASTAALVLVVALGVRLLARSSRPGPTLGAATVGGAVALVAGGIAVADGLGVLVAAASPPWRTSLVRWQEVAAGSVGVYGRYGWQVPVALIMLAATAWLLLGQWPEIAAGGAGLAALAVPAAFGLPWWAPVAVGVVAGGALGLLATLAHTPRGARAYATAGALLGLHGVGAGLARPAATALALAGIMAAGTAVAGMALRPVQTIAGMATSPGPGTSGMVAGPGLGIIGIGARPRPRARPAVGGAATVKARTKVGGAAVTGALFAAPGATAAMFAALNLPGRVIVQAAMATVAATLGAAAVLRLARTPYVAHAVAGVGAGAAVVAFSTLPAGEPVGPYGAVAGLIGIGAGLLLLPAPAAVPADGVRGQAGTAESPGRARPEPAHAGRRAAAIRVVGASALPVFAAVGAVLPGLFSVLALPYGWLPKIWTGSPITTRDAFPIGHWYGTGWDAVTLLLLTAAAALVALGLGGSRWVPAATLPPAAAALLVLPAAANLPWPAGPAVAAVVSLSAGLTASLVRAPESRPGLTTYRVGMAVCGLAGGAGMAGSLATVPMTLAGLATAVGGGLMVALVGRYRPARISGWLLASLAALVTPIVAGAAVRRSGGVPPPDAYGVLAVAALLIGVATLLSRQGRSRAAATPGAGASAAGTMTGAATVTGASGPPGTGTVTGASGAPGTAASTGASTVAGRSAAAGGSTAAGRSMAAGASTTATAEALDAARRLPESRAVEWCGYAGAALAVLRAGLAHSAVQAAVVLALWGILLGLTASRADRTAVYRAWLVRAALVSEVLAWWLFAQQSDVTLWEAYTLPFALLAVIGGILELRANPELNSWVAYGPALVAAFGPSLALILVETDSPTGRIRLAGIAVGAVLVVVLGGRARRQAPVLVGGVTLLVTAGRALVLLGQKVQWWILFGALGLVLVWVGATYERRRHDMRRLSARLKDMS